MSEIVDMLRSSADDMERNQGIAQRFNPHLLRRLACRIDNTMAELPRDRDGVPIHVGDTVYLDDGQKAEVISIVLAKCASVINCWTYGKSLAYMSSGISHKPADSWERIAHEFDEWRFEHMRYLVADDLNDLGLFAERIRKLAKKEEER